MISLERRPYESLNHRAALAGWLRIANLDEWLWNDETDDETAAWNSSPLQHVRLTLLGQAQTADRQYISPPLGDIENRTYAEPAVPIAGDQIAARRYRRRLLQSTVDLRNL